jgi:hypothetical protein
MEELLLWRSKSIRPADVGSHYFMPGIAAAHSFRPRDPVFPSAVGVEQRQEETMPVIARTLAITGYAAIVGGLAAAAMLTVSLDGWAALAAALLSGFAGIYAGVMALGFAANLRILSAMLDRRNEERQRLSSQP